MADQRRILRQWLETDAAFGVSEVPIPARRKSSPAKPVASAAVPAGARDIQAAVASMRTPPVHPATPPASSRPASAPVAPPRAAPPASQAAPRPPAESQSALIPGAAARPGAAKPGARAKGTPPPPAPEGDIADLRPLTRQQKIEALAALQQEIEQSCAAHLSDISTRVVFGEGDPDASLLFIGEGPGIEEDRTGRPFVGRSGQLLDKMISAIGYKRDTGGIYIANVVKLRCADWDEAHTRLTDRPPNPEEVARGLPFLHRQIEIIRPRVIVTLGAPAVKHLTGTTEGVMKLRGNWLSYRGIPVMPTYHPSFVLRAYTEENRRKVWSDLKAAAAKIKES